ncbi:MAG TPA: hypothetical protein VNX21_09725, partial [Candidatus Thermoplasmatota archaeon]|nr:hypothetical protein [Candidatus Thermoplasmatota archaeon]
VDGFEQAAKIKGVGSSVVALHGRNADVLLHDNGLSVLEVEAKAATTIRYALADGVQARALDGSRAVAHLYAGDAFVGSVVAVGGDGPDARGERVHVIKDEVHARARAGTQVVFLARPAYVQGDALPKALAQALAEGSLAATYVTELDGSGVAASQVDYGRARVETAAEAGGVRTTLQAQGRPLAASFDLAYETLPARAAEDVSVYIDGQLAQRAGSPAEVLANLRDGLPTYYAAVHAGRSQVLASTPGFGASGTHTITLAAAAKAATEAQARAERRSEEGSRVLGDFQVSGGGKLLGDFVTVLVPEGGAELRSYTSLASRVEVFRAVRVEGNGNGTLQPGGHRLVVQGERADLTLVDDAFATLQVEAKASSEALLALAEGVRARAESRDVVSLHGPSGRLGVLVLTQGEGIRVGQDGDLRARLHEGGRLLFRSAPEAFASDDAVASAIAGGRVGAQLLAGRQGDAVATSGTAFLPDVAAHARAEAGRIVVEYASAAQAASSFVLDARGSAVLAKAPEDVAVTVDGQPAVPVASPQAVFEAAGYARYHAETSADGDLRVLVNAAQGAGGRAVVVVESRLDAAARAAQGTDAFGAFKVFHDGTAVGSFVRLRADRAAGAVSDYGLVGEGAPVFASLVAGASPFVSNGLDGATTLVLENGQARIEAADATSGFLKVVAKERTEAAFRLGGGYHTMQSSDRVLEVRDRAGAHVGSLVASGGVLDASGDGVRATLQKGGHVLWRAHVGLDGELSHAQRSMVSQAIAAGRIAGQVLVRAPLPGALEATSGSAVDAVTARFSGDVDIVTAATRDRVDVTLSSHSPIGKTLLLTLDPATLPGLARGDAVVLFDGVPAAEASSFADVLDATDDGDAAEYLVLAGESGTQVLVSVPHFSVHTVTLQEREAEAASPVFVYATIVLGIVAVAQAAILALRRRSA